MVARGEGTLSVKRANVCKPTKAQDKKWPGSCLPGRKVLGEDA